MKKQKTAAAFLSAVMFCAAVPAFPAVYAADAALPAWVPQDFEKALEFQNTYGATHAADGVYCIVKRMKNDLKPQCDEHLSNGAAERIFQTEIRYEAQDGMPDLESMSAKERAEWEANAEQRRMEEQYNADVHYFVSVWKPTQAGDNEIIRQYSFADATVSASPLLLGNTPVRCRRKKKNCTAGCGNTASSTCLPSPP